ncbi:hypothetical protein F441_18184 [Phytophthora nicotianae CJ01A1]|nr:hypothetical protein F444_18332 [Phytophthora nicotianae P1976]ETP05171.1 hypothetical protein F441_18184 [Phytophthora nicotianae CJ01A1]
MIHSPCDLVGEEMSGKLPVPARSAGVAVEAEA